MLGKWIKTTLMFVFLALVWVFSTSGVAQAATITGTFGKNAMVLLVDSKFSVIQTEEAKGGTPFTLNVSNPPLNADLALYLFADGSLYPMIFSSGTKDAFQFTSQDGSLPWGLITVGGGDGSVHPTTGPVNGVNVKDSFAPLRDRQHLEEIQDSLLQSQPALSRVDAKDVNGLIELGKAAVRHGWAVAANQFFQKANELAVGEVKNKTRILSAISRVAALALNTASRNTTSYTAPGTTVGDFLSGFGCSKRHLGIGALICPKTLPLSSPTGGDISGWLNANMIPELRGAIATLNEIPTTMLPFVEQKEQWESGLSGSNPVEMDYSDVLVVKSILEFMLGQMHINQAYDLNGDIDAALSLNTEQQLLTNPNFGTRSAVASTSLGSAKAVLLQAADDFLAAIKSIQAETDIQGDDFVTLDLKEVASATKILNEFKSSMAGSAVLTAGVKQMHLDLSKFFDGVDLRLLMPKFTGSKPTGLFPDDTMRGIFPDHVYNFNQDNLNKDVNNNKIPDILEGFEGMPSLNGTPGTGATTTILPVINSGGATTTIPGGLPPTTIPGGLPPTTIPGGLPPTTIPGGLPPTTIPGGLPPTTIPGGLPPTTIPGGLPPTTIPGGLPPTTIPGGLRG
ncbi:MAG: hypothetical protein H7839_22750, partial [Magnetococcus sp. YQC-5]